MSMSINHTKRLFRTAFAAGFLALALAFISTRTSAQSRNFKLTQSLEIQYNILRTLATEYVDTVNFSKLVNFGIDAMLESIDPYTEFVPEENEETIEMMTTASYGGHHPQRLSWSDDHAGIRELPCRPLQH